MDILGLGMVGFIEGGIGDYPRDVILQKILLKTCVPEILGDISWGLATIPYLRYNAALEHTFT